MPMLALEVRRSAKRYASPTLRYREEKESVFFSNK